MAPTPFTSGVDVVLADTFVLVLFSPPVGVIVLALVVVVVGSGVAVMRRETTLVMASWL
jgi:hypothetical protein